MAMPKEYLTHKFCEHGNTRYDRWKCRAPKRHAGCDHKQNVSHWQQCENGTLPTAKES